jgi:hypothetical protein
MTKPRKPGRPRQFPEILSLCVSVEMREALERAQQAHGSDYNISHIARAMMKQGLMDYGYWLPSQPSQPSANGGNQYGALR